MQLSQKGGVALWEKVIAVFMDLLSAMADEPKLGSLPRQHLNLYIDYPHLISKYSSLNFLPWDDLDDQDSFLSGKV